MKYCWNLLVGNVESQIQKCIGSAASGADLPFSCGLCGLWWLFSIFVLVSDVLNTHILPLNSTNDLPSLLKP